MTKEEFQELAETEGFDKAMSRLSEDVDNLHDEDLLIMFVKDKLDSVDYPLAAHVLNGIVNSEGDSRWYDYDFSCGTLDKPVCINTVEEALTFDYFD
jgi:hypothetical protein